MKYDFRVNYRKEQSGKERGTGNISEMRRPIRKDVLKLLSSLETENQNKHIHITVSTEDFDISIISIQEL